MITIDRNLIRQVLPVFKRAVNGGHRIRFALPVQFLASPEGLRLRITTPEIIVEYEHIGDFEAKTFAVPLEVLAECQGQGSDAVQFDVSGSNVLVEWTDDRIPCRRTVTLDPASGFDFPESPAALTDNPPTILSDLGDAVNTCDPESSRYALGCVQLRGGSGQIVATDGRQLLVQRGYEFPWTEEILIPATKVFGSPELHRGEPVHIGRTEKHVTLCIDSWTIHIAVNQEGRFPKVDDMLCLPAASSTQIELAPADVDFLSSVLKRLPSDEYNNNPVTLDLNGQVIVRARAADESQPMELVLSNSRATGDALRISTNRQYLARAAKLGFTHLHLYGDSRPVIARDERRQYLWALLAPEGALAPAEGALRVESPLTGTTSPTNSNHRRRTIPVSTTSTSHDTQNGRAANPVKAAKRVDQPSGPSSPIEQAAVLKSSLRQAVSDTNELIRSLKRQRKQARLVQSTLASLKELKAVS